MTLMTRRTTTSSLLTLLERVTYTLLDRYIAMILGVVFGTLSSIFIAAPTAYLWLTRGKNTAEVVEEKK